VALARIVRLGAVAVLVLAFAWPPNVVGPAAAQMVPGDAVAESFPRPSPIPTVVAAPGALVSPAATVPVACAGGETMTVEPADVVAGRPHVLALAAPYALDVARLDGPNGPIVGTPHSDADGHRAYAVIVPSAVGEYTVTLSGGPSEPCTATLIVRDAPASAGDAPSDPSVASANTGAATGGDPSASLGDYPHVATNGIDAALVDPTDANAIFASLHGPHQIRTRCYCGDG